MCSRRMDSSSFEMSSPALPAEGLSCHLGNRGRLLHHPLGGDQHDGELPAGKRGPLYYKSYRHTFLEEDAIEEALGITRLPDDGDPVSM